MFVQFILIDNLRPNVNDYRYTIFRDNLCSTILIWVWFSFADSNTEKAIDEPSSDIEGFNTKGQFMQQFKETIGKIKFDPPKVPVIFVIGEFVFIFYVVMKLLVNYDSNYGMWEFYKCRKTIVFLNWDLLCS